jgi:CRP/FNR family transcriptional regulator
LTDRLMNPGTAIGKMPPSWQFVQPYATPAGTPAMPDATADLFDAFPALKELDEAAVQQLRRTAMTITAEPGTVLFRPGDACANYLLMLDGSVRVQMLAESGREIVLYRVGRGETCIITTSCLMGRDDYSAEGVAETPIRAVALPAGTVHALVARSPAFRDFVFSSFGARITNLMLLIQEVAFRRVDGRLAELLLARCDPAGTLALTHQALAVELGTAREVVSRQLKEFEIRGLVELGRGRIAVRDPEGLRQIAYPALCDQVTDPTSLP